jgi:antitoxin component YwqK of YwqJK toxin-antitoxin module
MSHNDKGEPHGLCKIYWFNGDLSYKSFYHNGKLVGYEENYYNKYGKLSRKKYNI